MKNSNVKVVRVPLEKGKYSTIQTSILFNNKLSEPAKVLLTLFLNNDSRWSISQSWYKKKLGWSNDKMSAAVNNLTLNGYLKIIRIGHNQYRYELSEYGNLDSKPEIENNSISETSKEENGFVYKDDTELFQVLGKLDNLLSEDEFSKILCKCSDSESDYYNLKRLKEILEEKKKDRKPQLNKLYNEAIKLTDPSNPANGSNKWKKQAAIDFDEWLKEELFNKYKLVPMAAINSKWLDFKRKHKIKKVDFESEREDYYEMLEDIRRGH